ncbi:hypothetical protein [Brevibacillus daliensis]|uniref:hypothetical protein n=1 Tax=Brevibacillus daliensis TaxID=2892995 RepID=UPI001E2BE20A|nr:hypothetical protein [Brevibacillus daliensis]
MMKRPMGVKIVFWVMAVRLMLAAVLILLFSSFFIPGGEIWESFKDGALGAALGIDASEYSAEYYGHLIGIFIIPVSLMLLSLFCIKKQMFKTLIVSILLQIIISLTQPFQLIISIVMLVLVLLKSSRDYLNGRYIPNVNK